MTAAGDGWATFAAIVIVAVPLMVVTGTVSGWLRGRLAAAAEEAARRLDGRYAPGSHLSGGTITGRAGGKDVVIDFRYGSSSRPSRTTAIVGVRVRAEPLVWRRSIFGRWPAEAARVADRLDALGAVEVLASVATMSVGVSGIVRDADRLVRLAEGAVALAAELDRA